jgi:hypothetical protein
MLKFSSKVEGFKGKQFTARKETTPLKPTAGFHPSEPSLAGDPGLNGAPAITFLSIRFYTNSLYSMR